MGSSSAPGVRGGARPVAGFAPEALAPLDIPTAAASVVSAVGAELDDGGREGGSGGSSRFLLASAGGFSWAAAAQSSAISVIQSTLPSCGTSAPARPKAERSISFALAWTFFNSLVVVLPKSPSMPSALGPLLPRLYMVASARCTAVTISASEYLAPMGEKPVSQASFSSAATPSSDLSSNNESITSSLGPNGESLPLTVPPASTPCGVSLPTSCSYFCPRQNRTISIGLRR